jgi:hypothetical protein
LSTPGANLGARLGYVWGGCAAVGAVWAWFFMPELKGRSLEDIDELFDAGLQAWKFKQYECTGINREALEGYRGKMREVEGEDGKNGERVELETV